MTSTTDRIDHCIERAAHLEALQIRQQLRARDERRVMTEQIVHMLDGQVRRRCERMSDQQLAEFLASQLLEEAK